MNGKATRFNEYQLVVLKKLWLISDKDWAKYNRVRRELTKYLTAKGYNVQTSTEILTQRNQNRYKITIPFGVHLREYLNPKIESYNKSTIHKPIEMIGDLTELYQKREVLVA